MSPIHCILHPTDFSERSEWAFRLATSLARDHGASLIVLHVYAPPVFHGEVVARRQPNGFHEQLLQQLRQVRPTESTIQVTHLLEEGEPAQVILGVASEQSCDLIVLGTHGRTGLRRALMGSVAEQVVRQAPCPVLTVSVPIERTAI